MCVPTYNEAENLEPFTNAVLTELTRLGERGVVLIIDDNSPDGTGAIADRLAAAETRVHVLHRKEKNGIGTAYLAGFAWTRRHRSIKTVIQMDCDFSHDPSDLGRLLEARASADVVLGSRWVHGGRVLDWPWWRRALSRGGSWYARRILGVHQRDLTGGFKCFGPGALARIPLVNVSATGYGFQIETTWRALQAGLSVTEVPITFRDRTHGSSKMSSAIAREAALMVPRLRWGAHVERGRARVREAVRIPTNVGRSVKTMARGAASLARAVLVTTASVSALTGATVAATSSTTVVYVALSLEFVVTAAIGVCTLMLMLYAWRDEGSMAETEFPPSDQPPRHSFSLIVPARHEEQVLATSLRRLAEQQHPRFEVLVVVGDDDPGTERAAREGIDGDNRFRVIVDSSPIKSKPRALNTALPECTGDVVGIFDAEDQVAPRLLLNVDRRFQQTGADIVQGAVALMNFETNWYSVRNVLEYYFWFKSRLHFHAKEGFIPLGGNTVFVGRRWLTISEGWDNDCLAEDCDLGARLSSAGAHTVVAYSADLVTREETPATVGALLKQRTRWNQGFLQVLRKGDWRSRSGGSRALAFYTLSFPITQALMGLAIPLAIGLAVLVKLPIALALLSFVPLATMAAILVAELIGLAHFSKEFSRRARPLDYARLVLGSIPYQLLMCVASMRAAWRELRGINNWEKTAHLGAHL